MAGYKLNYDKSWLTNAKPLPDPASALPNNFRNSSKRNTKSAALAVPIIASAVSSVVSSVFGNSAYKRQQRMMREQNAFQRRERELQNEWNLQQWQRENEYNSAKNQRARFQEAGLNPFLLMNASNAGTASPLTGSASGASAPSVPVYNPAEGFDNMINNALNREQQEALIESNVYSNYANSAYTYGKNSREESSLDSIIDANRAVADLNHEKSITETSQRYLNSLDAESKRILNKYLEPQQLQELAESVARVEKLGEELNLTRKQISKATEEILNLKTQGRLLKEELKHLRKTNDGIIAAENAESALREFVAKSEREYESEQAPDYESGVNRYKGRKRRDYNSDYVDKTYQNKRNWLKFNILELVDEDTDFDREIKKDKIRNEYNITKNANFLLWKKLGLLE